MKVLLVGSGGREHALAWKMAQSPRLQKMYAFPGNPGIAQSGAELLPGDPLDIAGVVAAARRVQADLVVIGPEDPLAGGLVDQLQTVGIPAFGPGARAARLEASKAFAKAFMQRHGIPTADFFTAQTLPEALGHLDNLQNQNKGVPVIKASGLAAGKGVILPESFAEARQVVEDILQGQKFGEAGSQVVIEERLVGREVSLLAFTDGKTILSMPPAQDHKRLLDGDQGPNTGGMGVFAPTPFAPAALVRQVEEEILRPVIAGMAGEGAPYMGVLYAGLMLTVQGPKVLEFNCRFGDPETQALIPLLDTDLLDIFEACLVGRLAEIAVQVAWKPASSVCVVLASPGYPNAYPKGLPIQGLGSLPDGVFAFHAGTRLQNGLLETHGGRVLGLTALGASLAHARGRAYQAAAGVEFPGKHYRLDIGQT